MNKKSMTLYILLALLFISACEKKVVINSINANTEPNAYKFSNNRSETITSKLPQRLAVFLYENKTLIPAEKNGGVETSQEIDTLEIIGKNGETEKIIDSSKFNYKTASNIKLIDNKYIFSNLITENTFLIIDIDNDQITKIPNYLNGKRNIGWSHKNNQFVFISQENDKLFLSIGDLKGNVKKLCQVGDNTGVLSDNSWSLDDKKIIFSEDNYHSVYVINSDGTEQKKLIYHDDFDILNNPQLSYDNKYLSYITSFFPIILNLESGETHILGGYVNNNFTWVKDENKFLITEYQGTSRVLNFNSDPNDLTNKITLVPNIDYIKPIPDKNSFFYYNEEQIGLINYNTLAKKVLKKDKHFIDGSFSNDLKSFIYVRNSDNSGSKSSLLQPVFDKELVLVSLDNINSQIIIGLNDDFHSDGGFIFKWSKDDKMVILSKNNLFDVEKNNIINIPTDKYIRESLWFD